MRKSTIYILGSLLFILISIVIILFYNQQIDIVSSENYIREDKVVIRFSCSWGGFDSKSDVLNQVIEAFQEENPHIEIINESMFGEDFLFTLKTNFASGNGPDIFGLWPGSDREILIEKGFVAEIGELIDADSEWKNTFIDATFDYNLVDDKIYSIPFETIYEGLFINTALLSRFNLEVPRTIGDLDYVIEILRKYDVTPIAYNSTPEGSFIYQNIVAQIGSKEDVEHPLDENGRIKQCYIDGMYIMRHLYEINAFPSNAFILDDVSRNELFMNEKAAMIVQGSWFAGEALEAMEDKIEIVPFPAMTSEDENQNIIYGIGNGNFHINARSLADETKKDSIIKFIKYLTSKETSEKFATLPGFIDALDYDNDKVSNLKRKGDNLIKGGAQLIGPVDHYIDRSVWETVLIRKFPMMLDGDIEPEDIFVQMGLY